MRPFGLHMRFSSDFTSVIDKALLYNLSILQSFFVDHEGTYIQGTPELIAHYQQLRSSFSTLYAHSSYAINLANHTREYHPLLKKEIKLASQLGFSQLILHCGARVKNGTKEQALDTVVRRLNSVLKWQDDVSIILENSGHLKKSLGGDIHDLFYIRSRLDKPERVGFCIDTAHAHVYGYDLHNEFDEWIDLVGRVCGDALSLMHLNDTTETLGSGNDRHCMLGKGKLGTDLLKKCATHPVFSQVPLIVELPLVSVQEERDVLDMLASWHA